MEEPLYKPREEAIGATPPKGQVLRETDSRILIDRKVMKIKDLPKIERPREKLVAKGAKALETSIDDLMK